MARMPAPPGPPPPHYRPPGSPRPPVGMPPPGPAPGSPKPSSGITPGAATAVALVTLLVGLVAGFFLGRAYDDTDDVSVGPVITAPLDPPPSTSRPPGDTIPQQPPSGSPSSPPATDLAPATIGSLEDPIPAGQAYVLGLYEIEVRRVDRDAAGALSDFDPSNPPAPAGQQHVLVELAVRFTDSLGLGDPAAIPFFLADGSGEWSSLDAACGAVPDALADAGLIEQGDEAVGQVCFTVPADAVDQVALGTESFAGPLYFALP